jgi:hypothetical protein
VSTQEAQQGGAGEAASQQEAQQGGAGEAASQQEAQQGGAGEAASQQEAQQGEAGEAASQQEAQQRAAYEAELSRITSADMVLQAAVSLLNIGARRLGLVGGSDPAKPQQGDPERDLEQVRDAIDAVRGLMPVVERRAPQEARPLRDALSQLQMAYARESRGAPPPTPTAPQGAAGTPPHSQPQPGTPPQPQPGTPPQPQPGTPPQPQPGPAAKPGPGPAESSGRLWVPGR